MTVITKYFVGGEMEAFYQGAPAGLTWTTSAGTYDPNFSRGAVCISNSSNNYIPVSFTSAQNTFWFSIQDYRNASGATQNEPWFTFVDGSLSPWYRIMGVGGSNIQPVIQMQYWSGSAWVAVAGIAIVAATSVLHKFDFYVDNATGTLAAYMDGIPFANQTGLPNHAIAQVQVNCTNTATFTFNAISECMCFDVSTLGRRLYTLGETANGTNSQWSGAYTDINEVGTFNDSNFIQTGTANQTSTFVTGTISSTPSQQYLVSGLVIAGRMLIGAVGPQNMKGAVVVGGTTYNSTNNVDNLLTNFGYTWVDFPVNPNTGVDWTLANINAGIETGWKSLA
jgi:hypothetical protein